MQSVSRLVNTLFPEPESVIKHEPDNVDFPTEYDI